VLILLSSPLDLQCLLLSLSADFLQIQDVVAISQLYKKTLLKPKLLEPGEGVQQRSSLEITAVETRRQFKDPWRNIAVKSARLVWPLSAVRGSTETPRGQNLYLQAFG